MRSGLAAVLLALTLSGCFGGGAEVSFASAMELREKADEHALVWADDATLVLVHSRERRPGGGEGLLDPEVEVLGTLADPAPGDGRAHAWEYTYRAAGKEPTWFRVRLHGDGRLIDALEHTPSPASHDSFARYGLDSWLVDSTGAAHVVADENWSRLLNDPLTTLDSYLFNAGGQTPLWHFVASNVTGASQARYADAVSGAARWYDHPFTAGTITPWPPPPMPERTEAAGSLSAVEPNREHALALLSGGHARLHIGITTTESPGGGSMAAELDGPNATRERWSWVLPTTGGWTQTYELPHPPAGNWTLRLSLSGLALDYEVQWCADAAPDPPIWCTA